jgi:hypothetical protein
VGSASILFCFDANGKDLWHAGIDPLHPFGLEFKRFPYTVLGPSRTTVSLALVSFSRES